MKVFIVQWLCPQRHCLLANAFEDPGSDRALGEAAAIETIKGAAEALEVHPWCGICGSTDLRYECAPTVFKSLEEAAPALTLLAQGNRNALELFSNLPKAN